MKNLKFLLILLIIPAVVSAQSKTPYDSTLTMRTIYVNGNITTVFLSPEDILTVDISSPNVKGDLPQKNILRIKPKLSFNAGRDFSFNKVKDTGLFIPTNNLFDEKLGVLTIIGNNYIAQYKLVLADEEKADKQVSILPADMKGTKNPFVEISNKDLNTFALKVINKRPTYFNVKSTSNKMYMKLNNIYTYGDLFFIDVEFKNTSNIPYTIDQIRYRIEDKKITKATNVQAVEVKPIYQLYNTTEFKHNNRNVLVFDKFTYPGDKTFVIELAEKQISGRVIYLQIDYTDILNADTL